MARAIFAADPQSGATVKRLIVTMLGLLAVATASAATPLAATIDEAVRTGANATLPPNLSAVLGLGKIGQATRVRQLLVRKGHTVHAFNVDPLHRHEIVLFVADEDNKTTTAYLMTAAGRLRKAITYHGGEAPVTIPRAHAAASFAAESDSWTNRDTAHAY